MRFFLALLTALMPSLAFAQSLGSPDVLTRPANDNSTKAASTAFVNALLAAKIPVDSTSFAFVSGLAKLNTTYGGPYPATGPANAIMAGVGNQVSFCPQFSCPATSADHQRTSLLVAATTQDDGHSEEQTVAVLTTNNKGYNTDWAAGTAYANGANVNNLASNNNGTYRQVSGSTCTSGSTAPTGTGLSIVDNSCRWMWINDAAVNGKVGIYNEIGGFAGGGAMWGQATNVQMRPGYLPRFVAAMEFDLQNDSGSNCIPGKANCNGLYVYAGGANRSTALATFLTANSGSNYAAYWGVRLAGSALASDVDVAVDSSAAIGLGFGVTGYSGAVTHSSATIKDASTSPFVLQDVGSHAIGIALNGSYSGLQIGGTGWSVNPAGALTTVAASAPVYNYTPTTYSQYACNAGTTGMTRFINDGNITPVGNYWAVVSGGGPYYGIVVCDSLNWRWH